MSRRSQGIATWVLTVGFCLIAASVWALEIVRQKNVATFITFPLIDSSDDVSLKTGAAASGDSEIDTWADGTTGAPDGFADVSGEIAEIGSTGVYYLSLTATEMNYDYIAVKVTATGVNPQFLLIRTTAGSHKNMATTDDGGTINVTTGAVDTVGTVNGLASGVITATAIADDAIDAGAIAENAIGASEIAASAITTSELVSGTVTLANGAHGGAAASFTFGAGGTISSSSGTALTITSSGGNGHGIEIDGNGSGNGVDISGGSYGILSAGGSTGARFAGTSSVGLQAIGPNVGIYAIGSSGHGAVFEGQGDPGHGLYLDKGTSGYDLYLGTPDTNLPVSGASAADIADAVWDEDITYHSTADSAGAALLLIEDIPTAVDTQLSNTHGPGPWR